MYGIHIVPPAGTELLYSEPASINDQGEIVGYSFLNTGYQAFLLVPCSDARTENCEDVTANASVSTQGDPEAAAQSPATADQGNLTPREMLALIRAQSGRRPHISSFPRKSSETIR